MVSSHPLRATVDGLKALCRTAGSLQAQADGLAPAVMAAEDKERASLGKEGVSTAGHLCTKKSLEFASLDPNSVFANS